MSLNKIILLVFALFVYKYSIGQNSVLYLCKEDGIQYRSIVRSGNPTNWTWNFEGGSYGFSNLQVPDPVYYPTAGTFKTYTSTTFDNGEIFYDTFVVHVRDWPIPSFYFPSDTGYCQGSNFNLTLQTTTFPFLEYLWNTGQTTSSITVNTPGNFFVDLKIKSGTRTCDSIRKSVNVTENSSPTVNLGRDRMMCQSQIITLDAGTGNNYRYSWQPNGEITRTISVSLPGIYRVTVTNEFNCNGFDEIELIDSCPHFVFVPNAFSPNADGLNDFFTKVWNFTPKEYLFAIYNRWGEILFETKDISKGWDGFYNKELVQQDIYVYDIKYLDTDNKWYQLRGTFYVVR